MQTPRFIVIFVLASLGIVTPVSAQVPNPDTRPEAVLLLHGGGWFAGSAADTQGWVPRLKQEVNAVGIPVEYPLWNVRAAEIYTSNLALSLDRRGYRVVAMGWSAGGELADWLAARCWVAGAISYSGPTDLLSWQWPLDVAPWNVAEAQVGLGTAQEQYDASPVQHVRNCASPMFLAGGDQDALVPQFQQTEMANVMHSLGRQSRFYPYHGGHALADTDPNIVWGVYYAARDWLLRPPHLRGYAGHQMQYNRGHGKHTPHHRS